MQVLDDIWASIKGNAKTRIKDPVIGAFIVAWCFCNWDKLAKLFWGSQNVDERIKSMSESMTFSKVFSDVDLIGIPLLITLCYLFLLPWVSLWVKKKQNKATLSQHSQAVQLDIQRSDEQRELNKANLRANPEKKFLEQEVEIEIQQRREKAERRHKIKEYIDQKTKVARLDAEAKSTQAEKDRIELESNLRKEEYEKLRFNSQTALHKATLASSRFPAVYQMMDMLNQSLKEDDLFISLDGLSASIAALFGYDDAIEMMNDSSFSQNGLQEVKYLFHDSKFLAKALDAIAENENQTEGDLSSYLFDHVVGVMELFNNQLSLSSDEDIAQTVSERVNEDSYDILSSDELSGARAEIDTIFDEIYLEMSDYEWEPNNGLEVRLTGSASGNHRKESDVRGQDLDVNVTVLCKPIIGRFGLADYEVTEVGGGVHDYGSDDIDEYLESKQIFSEAKESIGS
ncbi:hypothetical protein AB6E16_19600 [Vibrio atlanticus]|uniref:hypothetical protein n=1 Tax=Vibrio TaxID=662 RepID=UPI00354EBBB3